MGQPLTVDDVVAMMSVMDADGDGEVDFGELVDYVEEHPYMIEPMISMRTILRNSVCGARYWREATEWRQRQFGPHADMSKVITYKKDLEVKETAYVRVTHSYPAQFLTHTPIQIRGKEQNNQRSKGGRSEKHRGKKKGMEDETCL